MRDLLNSLITFRKNRILLRTTILAWVLIITTLGIFVVATLPYQRRIFAERMASEARNIVTSIDQVTATALISEDYGTVVDHCARVVKESPSIMYTVLTRNDGFSLVHTKKGWEQQQRDGIWKPSSGSGTKAEFLKNDLVGGEDIFHYSYPFQYSGIDWGWIHIGLSLKEYNANLRNLYIRTIGLALLCIVVGMAASLYFAKMLTNPIHVLHEVTQRVASGDLSARAEIKTRDELESLGNSFNQMAEALSRSRKELIASHEYTENVMTSMNDILMVISPAGVITKVNRATLDVLGYAEEELIGKPIDAYLIHEGQSQGLSAPGERFTEVIKRDELKNHESLYISKDGSTVPVLFSASAMQDADGTVIGMVCVAINITKLKRAEEALKKARTEEELLKTQKLESIGTLAGGIAHDFNNLLQGVFGYISMAKATYDQREKSLAMLEQAEKALQLSVNLTSQLLTFSKGGKPLKKLMSIQPVVEDSVKFALSGSHANFEMDVPADLWSVEADAGQLAQVIQNIVLNANEAMGGSGTVRVSLLNKEIAKDTMPSFPDGGRFVCISIQDSGCGIPEQNLIKIFDPYFSTKQRGSGLGLASSYSIVKNHGGVIDVKSEVTKGSTFTIFLPAFKAVEKAAARDISPAAGVKRSRILLMDDEEIVRSVAQEMFVMLGHDIVTTEDGAKAVELFRQSKEEGPPFDLVILDLTVKGGMGGEEAIVNILKIDPDARAVVSSGYSDSPVVADYQSYGFSAVLSKPYSIDAITGCMRDIGLS